MFDGAVPIPKSGVPGIKEDMLLHITLIINISKGDGDVLEILCSAWPDSIEITKLFIRKSNKTSLKAYDGPEFKYDDSLTSLFMPIWLLRIQGKKKEHQNVKTLEVDKENTLTNLI